MIVTLTINPSIDKSVEVEKLIPEKKLRTSQVIIEAGGGGINVSRALHELGGQSQAVFLAGGVNGKLLCDKVEQEGLDFAAIGNSGNTRENFAVFEKSTSEQFRFVTPASPLDEAAIKKLKQYLTDLKGATYLVVSGSFPEDLPKDFLKDLAIIATQKNIKLVIDTSGPQLKNALEHGFFLLKPNLTELSSIAGKEQISMDEAGTIAQQLVQQTKCEVIVVSLGPEGALLAKKDLIKRIPAPGAHKVSTVGAGDSMVAGIVWMLEQDKELEAAVQFGIACGTAATINSDTKLFHKEDAMQFYKWMRTNNNSPRIDEHQSLR